jgi:hypothetical protein
MAGVTARRRTSSWLLLAALAIGLAGSAGVALAAPHACCPETASEETRPPAHPCASLAPTPCCQTHAAVNAPPGVSQPAAILVALPLRPASAPAASLRSPEPGAFASRHGPHGSVVLRL